MICENQFLRSWWSLKNDFCGTDHEEWRIKNFENKFLNIIDYNLILEYQAAFSFCYIKYIISLQYLYFKYNLAKIELKQTVI